MTKTRLFHEEGVRVFEPKAVIKECRCSDERVFSVLSMMSLDDREYMENAGKISMKCEFCSHEYVFDAAELVCRIPKDPLVHSFSWEALVSAKLS